MSSAKELESSRNTKMPLWPVKVGVNGCVPSKRYTITLLFCDPTELPSYFPLALLTFIAPQLNRMTRHSCIYWEFSCDFFSSLVFCKFLDSREKWKGYCLSGSPVRHPGMKYTFSKIPLYHFSLTVNSGFQIPSNRTQLISIWCFS